jgi:predicted nucleic acid-binding protein
MVAGKRKPSRIRKQVPAQFVLDCSVVFAWYFADENSVYADAIATSLVRAQALVPSLWPLEVANTLLTGERRKRSTQAQASSFLARLAALPIIVDDFTTQHAWSSTISLARVHGLSSYDATYLELAVRRHVPLATLDDNLKAAATKVGLELYKP